MRQWLVYAYPGYIIHSDSLLANIYIHMNGATKEKAPIITFSFYLYRARASCVCMARHGMAFDRFESGRSVCMRFEERYLILLEWVVYMKNVASHEVQTTGVARISCCCGRCRRRSRHRHCLSESNTYNTIHFALYWLTSWFVGWFRWQPRQHRQALHIITHVRLHFHTFIELFLFFFGCCSFFSVV